MAKKWKILGSEYLFRHKPWLTVRKDRLEMPSGKIVNDYYVIEYPAWINVIAIDREGRFVMVEQYRHGLRGVFTELVAGVAEEGEDLLEAAKRELMEETGYGNGRWRLNAVLSGNPASTDNLTYSFIAEDVEPVGERHLDDTEDIDVRLVSEQEVRRMLEADEIKQALMAAPLWKYFASTKR